MRVVAVVRHPHQARHSAHLFDALHGRDALHQHRHFMRRVDRQPRPHERRVGGRTRVASGRGGDEGSLLQHAPGERRRRSRLQRERVVGADGPTLVYGTRQGVLASMAHQGGWGQEPTPSRTLVAHGPFAAGTGTVPVGVIVPR